MYLKEKYNVEQVYFFGGVEIHHFRFDYLTYDSVPIDRLEMYIRDLIRQDEHRLTDTQLVHRHLQRVRFYKKLAKLGYSLVLKPVKTYEDESGHRRRKANCDVDMTYYLMREQNNFDRAVILSGDGDFLPVLKHLKNSGKQVIVLARSRRTAKEIKQFVGSDFRDFEYLRERLKRA